MRPFDVGIDEVSIRRRLRLRLGPRVKIQDPLTSEWLSFEEDHEIGL